jgi:hypothetical protein
MTGASVPKLRPEVIPVHHRQQSVTRTLLLSVTLASALGRFVAGDQQPARPPRSPKSVEAPIAIPMELLGGRPVIRAKVNGQGPFAWLIAPEAQATLIDQTLAIELKLKTRNESAATSQVEVEMELGTSKLANLRVDVADMARFVPDVVPAARPRGVISASAWPKHLITLDYFRWQVAIEPGSLPEPNRRDVFDLKTVSAELGLPVALDGRALSCRLDPLFPAGLLLPDAYATLLPLVGQPVEIGSMNTAKGRVMLREGRFAADATVGMFAIENPLIRFADFGETCIVGSRWLIGFTVTYDVANARVRLARQTTR